MAQDRQDLAGPVPRTSVERLPEKESGDHRIYAGVRDSESDRTRDVPDEIHTAIEIPGEGLGVQDGATGIENIDGLLARCAVPIETVDSNLMGCRIAYVRRDTE